MKVINRAEFRQKRIEEASIAVDLDDGGEPVVIPPPDHWPDDMPSYTRKPVEAIKAIIGAEAWERWAAAGGTAKELNFIFAETTKELQGADVPES